MTLLEAADAGKVPAIQKLLAAGAAVDARDAAGHTPLMLAAFNGSLEAVHVLREAGADLHARNVNGYTALHLAAQGNRADAVRALIDAGLDPDERTAKGSTPLMVAAAANAAKAAAALLEKGARPDAVNAQGKTALDLAQAMSAKKVLDLLSKPEQAGPPASKLDRKLWRAAEAGDVAKVRELLAAGASPHTSLAPHGSALKRAVAFGHLDAAVALMEAGADPHARDADGGTLLHDAAFAGNVALARLLLEKGLDVNAANKDGFTPLMAAALQANVEMARLLLGAGADPAACGSFTFLHKNRTAAELIDTEDRKVRKELRELLAGAGAPAGPADGAYAELDKFPAAAKGPAFQGVLELLAGVCTEPPKPWRKCAGVYRCAGINRGRLLARVADDQLRDRLRAADAKGRAALLLDRLQEEVRAAGFQLVRRNALDETAAAELLAFPTADKYAVLAALGTDGANYGHDTRAVIGWLAEMEKENPFYLTGCGGDFVAGKFAKPVVNAGRLAERMCAFCPDLLDGEVVDSPKQVAKELAEGREFQLWWG